MQYAQVNDLQNVQEQDLAHRLMIEAVLSFVEGQGSITKGVVNYRNRSMMSGTESSTGSVLIKKSEDAISNAVDRCLADGLIKMGSGIAVGTALSLIIFKRRMWPVTLGLGTGIGAAFSNCRTNLNTSLPSPK